MLRRYLLGILVVAGLVLPGCVVKVYQKEMPREDIIVEGNQGYLIGSPPKQGYSVEKKTRKIVVTEIELVRPKEFHIKYLGEKGMSVEEKNLSSGSEKEKNYGYIYRKGAGESGVSRQAQQSGGDIQQDEGLNLREKTVNVENKVENKVKDETDEEKTSEDREFVIYKVQKGDTLQKISYKFYGKYSLWPMIFEANKDKLEHPDSIYVGQELRIPVLDKEK